MCTLSPTTVSLKPRDGGLIEIGAIGPEPRKTFQAAINELPSISKFDCSLPQSSKSFVGSPQKYVFPSTESNISTSKQSSVPAQSIPCVENNLRCFNSSRLWRSEHFDKAPRFKHAITNDYFFERDQDRNYENTQSEIKIEENTFRAKQKTPKMTKFPTTRTVSNTTKQVPIFTSASESGSNDPATISSESPKLNGKKRGKKKSPNKTNSRLASSQTQVRKDSSKGQVKSMKQAKTINASVTFQNIMREFSQIPPSEQKRLEDEEKKKKVDKERIQKQIADGAKAVKESKLIEEKESIAEEKDRSKQSKNGRFSLLTSSIPASKRQKLESSTFKSVEDQFDDTVEEEVGDSSASGEPVEMEMRVEVGEENPVIQEGPKGPISKRRKIKASLGSRRRNPKIFMVDKILKHRFEDDQLQVLLRWKGYGTAYKTWEPVDCVSSGLGELLGRYFKKEGITLADISIISKHVGDRIHS